MYGQKVPRLRWIGFQLFAQFQDVVVNGSSARIVLGAPYFIEKFVSRNDLAGMHCHEL
jgi:hypothetical protein